MCASAIVWSGITEIAYGYSIEEALQQGRKRIDLSCSELFRRAGVNVKVHEGILKEECAVLYRADVRAEIEKLRDIDDKRLDELNADSTNRRIKWFKENRDKFTFLGGDAVAAGYRLLLERFGITETQAPVIEKSAQEIVFHSKNFCPTLEACKILGLDTRVICRGLNERSTDALIKLVDRRLVFSRNYQKLRPYTECCEEKITIT